MEVNPPTTTTTTNTNITSPSHCVNIKLPIMKKDTNGVIKVLPSKTAEEILARERERKARTTLLMALPEDHLAKFYKMIDAKQIWDAIKSIFEGLHKGYDRFKSLLSQLEIHGAGVSTEYANQKFHRSLPSSRSQALLDHLLVHRMSPLFLLKGLAVLMMLVLLMVFLLLLATTHKGKTLHHTLMNSCTLSLLINEMDLKWQVAMISMRLKKFYKKTGHFARECGSKGNQESRRRDAGNTGFREKDNGRRPGK
ncbi:hypothetical protein Tco_0374641 [Tanacetum coccineum]